jgi:transposase
MTIVAGFDVHRSQITFDALDQQTGEVQCGRIAATPQAVKDWVGRFPGREIHVAVEACTGWLFVCQALTEQGATPHLAEPTETAARKGTKRRAKTDRADARWLRTLLSEGRLPDDLPPAALERIEVAMAMVDAIDRQMAPIERELRLLARRQRGCQALMAHYGVGELTAPVILCELGDVSRLSASRQAVRLTGLDIGVHRSDRRSRPGKLTRQGSPQLRWALYESAQAACRPTSPDRADYLALKERGLSHPRASLTLARKLARRCFHTLRALGSEALEPVT